MLVVNFFGGSCTGKSTHSAGLFAELKKAGVNVEISREYCKNFFYEDTKYKLSNQFLITGKQIEQVETFKHGGVDVVIMDSPILLGAVYAEMYQHDYALSQAITRQFNTYDNFNILLERDIEFQPIARAGSSESSDKVQRHIIGTMDYNKWDKIYMTSELASYAELVSAIIKKIS